MWNEQAVTDGQPRYPRPMPVDSTPISTVPDEQAPIQTFCPFLAAGDGAWTAQNASTAHRCHAVRPAAALTVAKQRRLCLTVDHATCATFLAARELRANSLPPEISASPTWGWVRTTPIVDTSLGPRAALAAILADRRLWQVGPAIVLVAALGALGLSNLGLGGVSSVASPLASPVAIASPTSNSSPTLAVTPSDVPATPAPSPTVAATVTPGTTTSPSLAVTPAPSPIASARATYTVKSGDTLYGIAQTYGVSVTALKNFNGLTSNILHIGQVLLIP